MLDKTFFFKSRIGFNTPGDNKSISSGISVKYFIEFNIKLAAGVSSSVSLPVIITLEVISKAITLEEDSSSFYLALFIALIKLSQILS